MSDLFFRTPTDLHQEDEGNTGQDPGQKDDREQEDRLVVFVVVLLAGKQLIGIINIIEIQI